MNRSVRVLALLVVASLPAAAAPCDGPGVEALLTRVDRAAAQAAVLDSFPGDTYGVSRQRCAEGAQRRVMDGKAEEFLFCDTRPARYGGIEFGGKVNGRLGLFKSFTTDLKSLDPKLGDELCTGINACLFKLNGQPTSSFYQRLSAAWDGLSCPGE